MSATLNRRRFVAGATIAGLTAPGLFSVLGQSDKKFSLAIVGVAHIHTPGFIDLLKTRNDVRVKTVWDPQPSRAETAATKIEGAVPVKEVDAIWSDAEIKAVVICSETNRHRDLVLAAAK